MLKDGLVAGKMLGIVAFAFSTADPHFSTCAFKRNAREESMGEEVGEGRTLLVGSATKDEVHYSIETVLGHDLGRQRCRGFLHCGREENWLCHFLIMDYAQILFATK